MLITNESVPKDLPILLMFINNFMGAGVTIF